MDLEKRLIAVEEKLNRIKLPEENVNYDLCGFNQSFIDLFQDTEILTSILVKFLKTISNRNFSYADAVPIYKALIMELEAKSDGS